MTTINQIQKHAQSFGSFRTIQATTPCANVFSIDYDGQYNDKRNEEARIPNKHSWFYDIIEEVDE